MNVRELTIVYECKRTYELNSLEEFGKILLSSGTNLLAVSLL